eukprot:30202-Pelagococcus_subviridis.AAC.1
MPQVIHLPLALFPLLRELLIVAPLLSLLLLRAVEQVANHLLRVFPLVFRPEQHERRHPGDHGYGRAVLRDAVAAPPLRGEDAVLPLRRRHAAEPAIHHVVLPPNLQPRVGLFLNLLDVLAPRADDELHLVVRHLDHLVRDVLLVHVLEHRRVLPRLDVHAALAR